MTSQVLAPIVQKDTLSRGVERELIAYFEETLFAPLFALLADEGVKTARVNASVSAVASALNAQTLWYADGVFTGKFGSAVARELREMGATYDPRQRHYRLAQSKLPMDLRAVISDAQSRSRLVNQSILDTLKQIQENLPRASTGVNLKGPMDKILDDLHKQFDSSLSGVGVGVPPDFTPKTREDITKSYTENLDLFIKDFVEKRIPVLRRKVQENVFAGGRTDKLSKILQAEFGISKRKAAFLAEQETSLLVSKYRESRYKQVGARQYVWKTSRDGRVRHDHEDLNDKVFSWDNPPITNKATGARNNPGEDFGCRCIARPVLPIDDNYEP